MASSKGRPLSGSLAGVEAGLIFASIMAYIWWLSFGKIAPALAVLSALWLVLGMLLHTIRKIPWWGGMLNLAVYLPWGLFQQYLLNGYFLNRLRSALTDRSRAATTAAMLFSLVHLPNWFLMVVTLIGGYLATRFYLKERNLYVLGLAHGVLGFLVYLVVPDWVSHHLYVGPKWFPR
jgi:hypothetical protein